MPQKRLDDVQEGCAGDAALLCSGGSALRGNAKGIRISEQRAALLERDSVLFSSCGSRAYLSSAPMPALLRNEWRRLAIRSD